MLDKLAAHLGGITNIFPQLSFAFAYGTIIMKKFFITMKSNPVIFSSMASRFCITQGFQILGYKRIPFFPSVFRNFIF